MTARIFFLKWHQKFIKSVVDVLKNFWRISRFLQNKKWKKFVLISEPGQKCKNKTIFQQNYTQNCSSILKWPCCFSLRENLDVGDFLQNKFYNIDYYKKGRNSVGGVFGSCKFWWRFDSEMTSKAFWIQCCKIISFLPHQFGSLTCHDCFVYLRCWPNWLFSCRSFNIL